jgi:hypothetical protein
MDSPFIDLQSFCAALGGDIVGRNQIVCPGPGHSQRDRSLSIKLTAAGFICHSFCGDDWRVCQDYVRERLGLPRWHKHKPLDLRPLQRTQPQTDPKQNIERARRLWDEAQDPRIPLVIDYFASRALDLPADLCGSVLRFHPQCPWRTDDRTDFIPCLIAAFTSVNDSTITAVHRIRLDRPERWPKTQRKMLGEIKGSAIKLDALGARLAIAEGVESALAARQLGFGAIWALGSARGLAPVNGVNELIILGEHDEASRRAADACSQLWSERGKKVFLALPRSGGDFNDHLMRAR